MYKKIVILCVLCLVLTPSTMSTTISNKKKLSQNLEPEGNRLVTEFNFKNNTNITEFDIDKNILWQSPGFKTPHDAERLLNGNTLITIYGEQKVVEIDWSGNIIWEYGMKRESLPMDAERLENGNTLISDYGRGEVIEVNSAGDIVWQIGNLSRPMDAERFPNGNTLIVEADITSAAIRHSYIPGRVTEVDSAGNEVWSLTGLNAPVDAERLQNGNILITEHVGGNVTEFKENGEIVWQKAGLYAPTDAERLDNGNTLIAENGANRVIEIDPNGENVWVISGLIHPVDVEILPPPTIEIKNPEEGYFHLRGRPLFPFLNKTFIYGPIDIEVNIASYDGIEKIEFYINGKLKKTITGEENSHKYTWSPIISGQYTIKTIVYDCLGENASESINIFKWRAHPIVILTSLILVITLLSQNNIIKKGIFLRL